MYIYLLRCNDGKTSENFLMSVNLSNFARIYRRKEILNIMADYVDKERETDEMSSNFDLKSLWMMFIMHWQWFVLSVLLCLAGAFVYLRFKQPTYSADVKILIKEVDEGAAAMTGAMDLSQFGVVSNTNGFNNELEIISSKNLAIRTVKSLKLYVNYRLGGTVRDTEIYKNSPFLVDIEENRLEDLETPISLEITEAKEGVVVTGKEWTKVRCDITSHIDRAVELANRDNAYGVPVTKEDLYFSGVNIGFEISGNYDCTIDFKNFNMISYKKD